MIDTNLIKSKKLGGATAVSDPATLSLLASSSSNLGCLQDTTVVNNYLDTFRKWIPTTKNNTVIGLDGFPVSAYSNGTTESFDKFYHKHSNLRMRMFKGEYIYHKLAYRDKNWAWAEDEPLAPGDALIVSYPFSDTGNPREDFASTMQLCIDNGIPVMVDCAYFGTCAGITFDLTYECITDVVFSLSKPFPIAHARTGIRFSRVDDDDLLMVYHGMGYVNRIGAMIGTLFMDNFTPDYIHDTYKEKQHIICNTLGVTPSNTVLFGIGNEEWAQYNRGGPTNRLSLQTLYTDKDIWK